MNINEILKKLLKENNECHQDKSYKKGYIEGFLDMYNLVFIEEESKIHE